MSKKTNDAKQQGQTKNTKQPVKGKAQADRDGGRGGAVKELMKTEWSLIEHISLGNQATRRFIEKVLKKNDDDEKSDTSRSEVLAALACCKFQGPELLTFFKMKEGRVDDNAVDKVLSYLVKCAKGYQDELKSIDEELYDELTGSDKVCQKILKDVDSEIKQTSSLGSSDTKDREEKASLTAYKLLVIGLLGERLLRVYEDICEKDVISLCEYISETFRMAYPVENQVELNRRRLRDILAPKGEELLDNVWGQGEEAKKWNNGEVLSGPRMGECKVLAGCVFKFFTGISPEVNQKKKSKTYNPNDYYIIFLNKLKRCGLTGERLKDAYQECDEEPQVLMTLVDERYYEAARQKKLLQIAFFIASKKTYMLSATHNRNQAEFEKNKAHSEQVFREVLELVKHHFQYNRPPKQDKLLLAISMLLVAVTTDERMPLEVISGQARSFAPKWDSDGVVGLRSVFENIWQEPLLMVKKACAYYILTCTDAEISALQITMVPLSTS